MNNEGVKIEETERYQYLMEESLRQFPMACMWMIHCAVCEQILEEQGVAIDDNDVHQMRNIYCKKLEYDDMISCENIEDEMNALSVKDTLGHSEGIKD